MQDDPPEDDADELDGIPVVTCTFCNNQVSDVVKRCPYCGSQLIAEWSWIVIGIYVLIIAGATFGTYYFGNK